MTAHVHDGSDPRCDRCWDVEIDSNPPTPADIDTAQDLAGHFTNSDGVQVLKIDMGDG